MKLVYSNESHFLANNIKNLLEAESIESFIKNEFAQGALGEVSAFDSWPEVWVVDEAHYQRASEIVAAAQQHQASGDWSCPQCAEKNDPSFEICWSCQYERTQ